ncbi:hypothetical protein COLAER_02309 [Collinsella aerofaciens ATCC 25986]|uniref:Uncharacterized protein n=1 Tax=Collinsella aerofaciens (strain ATCC 25986 / DSM 3979 / JCM 10188 / KCTC 3647 / NCTC 11838 / VPI 1003) TaxID=411903 RepID=A4ECW9_COLAA|nr:hypothetical protein COLAER_02309 [Collinsella aerofaciens ATCC 25986]
MIQQSGLKFSDIVFLFLIVSFLAVSSINVLCRVQLIPQLQPFGTLLILLGAIHVLVRKSTWSRIWRPIFIFQEIDCAFKQMPRI